MYKVIVAFLLAALPALSFANVALDTNLDGTRFAPEPETLGLIAGAAIAWAIVRWKKRK
jgi:hypothetical protein